MTGPTPRARLADLARQAGVSEATVSRVLNDKPGVSPDTRQAVLTALDVLGYERPHKRSAGLVGLVVPELDNPIFAIFAIFAQAIESMPAQEGYTAVLCTHVYGGITEDEYVEMPLRQRRTFAGPLRWHASPAGVLVRASVGSHLGDQPEPFAGRPRPLRLDPVQPDPVQPDPVQHRDVRVDTPRTPRAG